MSKKKRPQAGKPAEPTQEHRLLLELYRMPEGQTLNFQQAAHGLCIPHLHSGISALQKRHGVPVCRKPSSVKGWHGIKSSCKAYWLDDEGRQKAKPVLEAMEAKRRRSVTA